MIINKEGKLFGKVSVIDIFVVLVIAVMAFGVYTRFFSGGTKADVTNTKIEYKIKVKSVRQGTVDALKKGGAVYDTQTKEYMGRIVSTAEEPCLEEQKLLDGSYVMSEVPERQNVIVTLSVDGATNASGYYTSENKPLYVGSTFVIATPYAETTGEIVSVGEAN